MSYVGQRSPGLSWRAWPFHVLIMAVLPKAKRLPWQPPAPKPWTHRNRWEGYKTNRWKRMSLLFKTDNPVCITPGCGQPTYYTDHVIRATQCPDPWDSSNWQPLCRKCGDSKAGKESAQARKVIPPGGGGNAP